MRLSEETIRNRLECWPVARLATAAADGRPQQVPIVFAYVAGRLWSPIDGKPKSGRELERVRNLRARPDSSLLLDEYTSDWSRLWWIRIDATGEVFEADRVSESADFAAVTTALQEKYPQYRETPMLGRTPQLIAFRIVRIRSWTGAGPSK